MTSNVPSKILLAEDDPIIREVTVDTLCREGYHVVAVSDGEEALAALSTMTPDLILSDVRLPRCDGFEFLRRIRSHPDHEITPFIIMSAKVETSDQRMGMSLGADDYVTKPYLPADLLKTIDVRLKRAAMINQRRQHQQRFLLQVLPHELRTPLSGIIGYADLMMMMGEAGDVLTAKELVDYGQNIGRSGQRLLNIAEDFSLWSWLEWAKGQGKEEKAGKGGLLRQTQITPATLRSWCENCVSGFGRQDDLAIEGEPVTVIVAAEGLERVIAHLVNNAMKFSLPGEHVLVKIIASAAACEIRVIDHGRGIQESDLPQFGLMRQFGREKFEQQGIGMGVELARNFALFGGGDFTLANNVPGPGVTTCLKLVRAVG